MIATEWDCRDAQIDRTIKKRIVQHQIIRKHVKGPLEAGLCQEGLSDFSMKQDPRCCIFLTAPECDTGNGGAYHDRYSPLARDICGNRYIDVIDPRL